MKKSLTLALAFVALASFAGLGVAQEPPKGPTANPIGCFRDQGDSTGTSGRDLNGFVTHGPNMTTAACINECQERGFAYAGTQYSSWCFCGNQYGKSGAATNCNMACSGNAQEICGGAWANSIYPARATAPPTPVAWPGMEMQIDRPGSDYRSFDLPAADPGLCQAQCMQEGQCVAWTFVNPRVQGPQARCWLKSSVSNPTPSTCCVSGVKTSPQPKPPVAAGLINVQSATYGANCGAPANNVTGHAKQTCDGKGTCDYRVDYGVIGDPVPGCPKNYTVNWTCGSNTQVRSASAPPEAGYGSLVQLACTGQPPVVVTPITPPVTPPPQAINLTGRWMANDGGTYYLRQIGNDLWWYGRSGDGGATWSNVLNATIQGNRVAGRWADVPQGQIQNAGEMEISITSPDRLTATRRTGGFSGSEWTRQR